MARQVLLERIAEIISDYRAGEIPQPTPGHVDRWVRQFTDAVQEPILEEMAHVLQRTYFTKQDVAACMSDFVVKDEITRGEHCRYWQTINFLNIQKAGNSQRDMLAIFDAALRVQCQFGVADCGQGTNRFVYIDDAVFSGGHVIKDLNDWITTYAPNEFYLSIMVIGLHKGGRYYACGEIRKAAERAGKTMHLDWQFHKEIENRKADAYSSDVLWPVSPLPDDPDIQSYAAGLGFPVAFRAAGNVGQNAFFSSDQGRQVLEQEFLKAGVTIRGMCPNLNDYQRPLGNMVLKTLGFGSLIVTFRNCPNNAPLALWAGDPWYPLFLRKTN